MLRMMGKSHALSGWCAGLLVAPLAGVHDLPAVVVFAATTAGAALLPDLDHPGSHASRSLGAVTGAVSAVLCAVSAFTYRTTRTARDDNDDGTHRALTHTLLFAVTLGAAVTWLTRVTGGIGAAVTAGVTVALMVALAARATGPWVAWVAGVAAVTTLGVTLGVDARVTPELWAGVTHLSGPVGVAVGVGCVVHSIGDGLTRSGVPLLWPLPIRGRRWFAVRLPELLRFHTGHGFETRCVMPLLGVGAVLLVPGVWAYVWPHVVAAWNAGVDAVSQPVGS